MSCIDEPAPRTASAVVGATAESQAILGESQAILGESQAIIGESQAILGATAESGPEEARVAAGDGAAEVYTVYRELGMRRAAAISDQIAWRSDQIRRDRTGCAAAVVTV